MKRRAIFWDYFTFWLWIDLVSSIPYTWILAWSQGLSLKDIESDNLTVDGTNMNSALTDAP